MRHVDAQHAAAGARGHDDVVIAAERVEDAAREVARGRAVAGIIGRLPAAGLRPRHLHLAARLLQQADRGEAHGRAVEIDEAGDEERDARLGGDMAATKPGSAFAPQDAARAIAT